MTITIYRDVFIVPVSFLNHINFRRQVPNSGRIILRNSSEKTSGPGLLCDDLSPLMSFYVYLIFKLSF